jgi:Kdo2-lipid IVA lauroyltransferase/acyltransferase
MPGFVLIWLIKRLSRLPMPWLYGLSDVFYFLGYRLYGYRRHVVRTNLKNAGLWSVAIEKAFYKHLADLVVETIKCVSINEFEIKNMVAFRFEQQALVHQSFVVVAGHCGNWELANLRMRAGLHHELRAVHQPLTNAAFDAFFLSFRSKWGTKMYPKTKGVKDQILANLSSPAAIVLINDQATKHPEAFACTFLNQTTKFQNGPVQLAFEHGLPLYYAVVKKQSRGQYCLELEPIDKTGGPLKALETYVNLLERDILAQPANWLWSHKRWK